MSAVTPPSGRDGGLGSRRSPRGAPATARVAIVEDEGVVALYLQSLLTDWGYEVVATIASGEDAVAFALESPPDLVLMDIQLRGEMDGIAAARAISATHDLPFVFLTAFSDDSTVQLAGSSGAYGYVRKPFDERDLRIAVEMALVRHRADLTLRHRGEWLDATLSSVSDGVIATDRTGRVRFMNPAAERLIGRSQTLAVDHELSDVMGAAVGADAGPGAKSCRFALTTRPDTSLTTCS